MKKSVFNYLGQGYKNAKICYKDKRNIISYWIYLIAKLLSFIILPFMPLQAIADLSIGSSDKNRINIVKSFKTVDDPKKYWDSCVLLLLKVLIFLSGFILVGLAGVAIFSISLALPDTNYYLLIPFIVFEVIYVIIFYIYQYESTYYLYLGNSPTEALTLSFAAIKHKGKAKIIMLSIINALQKLIIPAVLTTVIGVFGPENRIIIPIIIIVSVIVVFTIYPFLSFASLNASYNLKKDLASESVEIDNDDTKSSEEAKLAALFDDCLSK